MYPSSPTAVIESNYTRHSTALTTDPNVRYIVAFDPSLPPLPHAPLSQSAPAPSQLVAFIKYYIYPTPSSVSERKDTGTRTWPEGTNLPLVENFWGQIVNAREVHGGGLGAHVLVDLLATSPEYQGRGAGRMLMEEAVRDADKEGLPSMLEGSPAGLKLYESCGFRALGEFWTDLKRFEGGVDRGGDWRGVGDGAKEGVGEGWYRQVVMRREPKRI